MNTRLFVKATIACATVGWLCWNPETICMAQTPSASAPGLSSDLQEIVALSRQQLGTDVITNYIKVSRKSYRLTADDIINLKEHGVSPNVITALLQTAAPGSGATAAPPSNPPQASSSPQPSAPSTSRSQSPVPPPLDASTPPGANPKTAQVPLVRTLPATVPSPGGSPIAPVLADNFFADVRLDPALWETQSRTLAELASRNGTQVLPILTFSRAGMQMTGIQGGRQFMGIISRASFAPPFSLNVTVSGMMQTGIPFEVYLVSADLRQWVSVAGHLGGRDGRNQFFYGDGRLPYGMRPEDYGVWVNYAGSRRNISALGNKLAEDPIAGVPYTIRISAGADGVASVTLLDSSGFIISAQDVPIGSGPFFVVLAGRGGTTFAIWRSVKLTTPVFAAPVR